MNPYEIIERECAGNQRLHEILLQHSRDVATKALQILDAHPELQLDRDFVREAALLHDIGIGRTNASGIFCYGSFPYIAHGYLGADLLRAQGFPRHALVCERHTGAGISLGEILAANLPLPHRDMLPLSLEEQLICFADKFFSKTHPGEEKTLERARRSVSKHGAEGLVRFNHWCTLFL